MTPTQAAAAPKPSTIIQQVTPDGTHVITTVAAVQAAAAAAGNQQQPQQQQVVVQAQKAVTTTSGMTITPVIQGTTTAPQQHSPAPVLQNVTGTAAGAPSSLIKSLLANKVTTTPPSVVVHQSPVKTVVTTQKQTFVPETTGPGAAQQKTQFYINTQTNTNPSAVGTPPAGAVAAASVIMSNVAAQSARPTASVPINNSNNSSKFLQMSPGKGLKGHPPLVLASPQTHIAANNPPNVIASNAMNVRQVIN